MPIYVLALFFFLIQPTIHLSPVPRPFSKNPDPAGPFLPRGDRALHAARLGTVPSIPSKKKNILRRRVSPSRSAARMQCDDKADLYCPERNLQSILSYIQYVCTARGVLSYCGSAFFPHEKYEVQHTTYNTIIQRCMHTVHMYAHITTVQ